MRVGSVKARVKPRLIRLKQASGTVDPILNECSGAKEDGRRRKTEGLWKVCGSVEVVEAEVREASFSTLLNPPVELFA